MTIGNIFFLRMAALKQCDGLCFLVANRLFRNIECYSNFPRSEAIKKVEIEYFPATVRQFPKSCTYNC